MVDPLRTRVRELLQLRRDLLCVLALAGQELSRTDWAQYAARCRVRVDPRRHMNAASLRPEIAPCLKSGLLVETSDASGNLSYRVESEAARALLRDADARYRLDELIEGVRQQLRVSRSYAFGSERRQGEIGLELLVAFSREDAEASRRLTQEICAQPFSHPSSPGEWLSRRIGMRPSAALLEMVHVEARQSYLSFALEHALGSLADVGEAVVEAATRAKDPLLRLNAGRCLAMRGDFAAARAVSGLGKPEEAMVELSACVWEGDFQAARAAAEIALKSVRRRKHKQLPGMEGVLLQFARVAGTASGDADWEALERDSQSAHAAKVAHEDAYAPFLELYNTASSGQLPELPGSALGRSDWLGLLSYGLCRRWLGLSERGSELLALLRPWLETARAGRYLPIARELEALVADLEGDTSRLDETGATLFGAYEPKAPWEVALETLEALTREVPRLAEESHADKEQQQLIFRVFSVSDADAPEVEARLRKKSGQKGKVASPARLLEGEGPELTEADRLTLARMARQKLPGKGRVRAEAEDAPSPLVPLVGHPRVVNEDGAPLVVKRKEAELRSRPEGGDVLVEIFPPELAWSANAFEWTSPQELWIYERTPELARVAAALPEGVLRVPGGETRRLSELVQRLGSRVRLGSQSDSLEVGEVVAADTQIAVELDWNGTTLELSLVVFPLGTSGGATRPGQGNATFVGPVDGQLKRCVRDLDTEQRNLEALEEACPSLRHLPRTGAGRRAESVESALDCLSELHAQAPALRLLWPKERRLAPPKVADLTHLRTRVGESHGWLEIDPRLEVDEDTVLTLRDLLGRRRGQYVELGEENYVRLTEDLARRLDDLDSLGTASGEVLQTSAASLPRVQELLEDVEEVSYDANVLARLDRLSEAVNSTPALPRNFDATLRDYQLEGYHFLARLADAGMGACLADDMGLGKTVQTLALLLRRAKLGPALVVAPTTVVRNWANEARRFAPTLRCVELRDGDRERILADLGPRDLLLTSYGLLVTESERLAAQPFASVIFDEAHALKNARTQRAKAAHELNTELRVALTGTPIENHLGELWSVMQATLPGLLGTQSQFDTRFAQPIEAGDRERAQQLRALLRPFILRRTKAQVLDELPARTEITLRVQPTVAERAFYEALRRNALEAFQAKGAKNQKRMRVFAEIMRLRRAAVDPRLVDPELGPPGAKLDALLERLEALKEEGHRALVFSQFLGSLAMARERLEQAGIAYLTLDGSTSASERARRIEAFQDGEADVFLMSLKAGGVGVNLTGADYVIHLDPWWNPAVEEQATGRAHRIGQRRPVTVYRFVTEGSIEERILSMHQKKRALADDLLSGLDKSQRLDLDELRSLLIE
ncbi:MAG: DEAD/DEAH box helicase [Deltaproteobacteria bacterium]|nr:DEAD/DEAH box helicase [Deltaproteobacteria bacterium]